MLPMALLRSYERKKEPNYKHSVPNGTENLNPKLRTQNSNLNSDLKFQISELDR